MPQIGVNPLAAASNLPGALQPQYGLIGGLAEGFRAALGGYRDAKKDQLAQQTAALQNQMLKDNFNLKLQDAGLIKNPDSTDVDHPYTVDMPRAMAAERYNQITQRDALKAAANKAYGEKAGGDVRNKAPFPELYDPSYNPYQTDQGLLTPRGLVPNAPTAPAANTDAAGAADAVPPAQPSMLNVDTSMPSAPKMPSGLIGGGGPSPASTSSQTSTGTPAAAPGAPAAFPEFQKAQEELIELQRKNSDPLTKLGKTDQQNVEDLRKESISAKQTLTDLAPLIAQVRDESKTPAERKLAGDRAVKVLNGGNLRGGEPYKDLTALLEKVRLEQPYIGQQFGLFANQLDSEASKLSNVYNSNTQKIKNLVPGYKGLGDLRTASPSMPPSAQAISPAQSFRSNIEQEMKRRGIKF